MIRKSNSIKIDWIPFCKRVYSKRKEFALSKFFPFIEDPFQKGLGEQESKQEVTKVVFLAKNVKNLPSYPVPLNH